MKTILIAVILLALTLLVASIKLTVENINSRLLKLELLEDCENVSINKIKKEQMDTKDLLKKLVEKGKDKDEM